MVLNKMNFKLILLSLITVCYFAQAQSPKKYWIRFTNKTGTPYSINNPSTFLTQKSIDRRFGFGIPVVENDLPVTPSYVSQVDAYPGVQVLFASKWMNGVVVSSTNLSSISSILALPFVNDTFQVNKYRVNIPEAPLYVPDYKPLINNQKSSSNLYNYGASYWQNKQLNVDCLHDQGFRGTGITIAVMDAGFSGVDTYEYFDSIRVRGKILGTRDFVNGGTDVFNSGNHGTFVLSCMAAIYPGNLIGTAPDSDYWLFKTEEGGAETISEEYNWIRAAEFADSVGAHILTTSLGYTTFDNSAQNHSYPTLNGRTAPMSIAANLAARKGLFVVNSAGYEGGGSWLYISVPADADSICTVGAVDSLGVYAAFSGKGPTFDGRTKPDLVALGAGAWVNYNGTIAFPANGTSFSAPILAGAVACFWQAHKSFSNIQILDTLRKTASNAGNPNNQIGWGLPNMCAFPVGIKENANELQNQIQVFPNPFQSSFTLELKDKSIQVKPINLLDAKADLVFASTYTHNEEAIKLNFPDIKPGFYILQIFTSSGTLSKKMVVQ